MTAEKKQPSRRPEEPLLEVSDLHIDFHDRGETTPAVRGISFEVKSGETVAIVGESGSGKSVTALSFARLLPPPPACTIRGQIFYRGKDLLLESEKNLRAIRGREIAWIFQEPSASLNPVFTAGWQIAEAVALHRPDVQDVRGHVIEALAQVGIREPEKRYGAYPHELSGGMQQRVMIAMALACNPSLLVADEPTTALDVTIQKQILELLQEIRQKRGLSILLITHNFGIVSGFADRVVVMFRGKIVEAGPTAEVLRNPQHPYTRALIACIPQPGERRRRLVTIDHAALEAAS